MKHHETTEKRRSADAVLGEVAAGQHGLVTTQQARRAGLSRDQIRYRVASERWMAVAVGVYRLAGVPTTWRQAAMAACLATPDSAASHLTAAALAGLTVPRPPIPHVTVERGRSGRSPLAVVHTARRGTGRLVRFSGVPSTTVGRALVDCAAMLGPTRLQRLVDEAMHRNLLRPEELDALWDDVRRAPGRRGEGKMRLATEAWAGPIKPGSPAEARLRRQLVEWGFPSPEAQIPVHGPGGEVIARLDLGWPNRRLGLEYDGVEWHGPARWGADEDRHAAIERTGWRLLHVDKADLQPGARRFRLELERRWGEVRGPAPRWSR